MFIDKEAFLKSPFKMDFYGRS